MDKINGDDGRIRTLDPQSRNLVLYPAELRHRLDEVYHKIRPKSYRVYHHSIKNNQNLVCCFF